MRHRPRIEYRRLLEELRDFLDELIDRHGEPVGLVAGWLQPLGEEHSMGEVTVEVGAGPKRASVQFVDVDGNPVAPDATPSWSSGDESVAVVTAAEDGLSALVAFGNAGSAVIECSTDETDADGNVTTIRIPGLVNVSEPDVDAVGGEMTFSDEPA